MALRFPIIVITVVLTASLLPLSALAQDAAGPGKPPLFVHPRPVDAMTYDPWSESLWLAAQRAGVMQVSPDGSQSTLYTAPDGLPASTVRDIEPTPEGVWLGTSGGLVYLDRATGQLHHVDQRADGGTMHDNVPVVHHEAANDTLWIGTTMSGLFKLDDPNGDLVSVPNPVNDTRFAHTIYGFGTDGAEAWISVPKYGLVEWHRDTGEATKHNRSLELLSDEPYPGPIDFVGQDVWIGTGGQGALKYNRTTEMWQAFANPDNLQAKSVYDLSVRGHEVWFATETGVARYDYDEDRWHHWNADNGYIYYSAKTLAIGAGEIWASSRPGIATYDAAADTWKPQALMGLDNAPSWNAMTDCMRDGDRLLFATGGAGVTSYEPDKGRWTDAYSGGGYGQSGPSDALVMALEVEEDTLWFGTGRGVSELDKATGEWSYYRTDGHEPPAGNGIPDRISDLDAGAGALWIAAAQRGLAVLEDGSDELEMINSSDGLPADSAVRVAVQGQDVWVTSRGKLNLVNATTREVMQVYPKGDDTDDAAISFLPDGDRLWVGTAVNGLQMLDRDTLKMHPVPGLGDIPVKTMKLDGERLWAGGWRGTLASLPLGNGTGSGSNELPVGEPTIDDTLDVQPRLGIECMVRHEGLLYVGTLGGVHRYDIDTGTWLHQAGLPGQDEDATVGLEISTPSTGASVTPGEALTVEGRVVNAISTDVRVEARLDLGEWTGQQLASGQGGGFSLEVPTAGAGSGDTVVLVRVLDQGTGKFLASTAVDVTVEALGEAGEPIRAVHDPPLDAVTDEPVRLPVRVWNAPDGTTVTATVDEPGQGQRIIELSPIARGSADSAETSDEEAVTSSSDEAASKSVYAATLGPFSDPMTLDYTITVELPGGQVPARLPTPGGPFGDTYPLVVRKDTGFVSIFEPRDPIQINAEAGNSTPATIPVQNAGTKDTGAGVQITGEAADWFTIPSPELDLGALSTQQVQATVEVPAGTENGTYEAQLEVLPRAEPNASVRLPIEVVVGSVPTDDTTGQGLGATNASANTSSSDDADRFPIPLPGPSWLVITAAALGLALRRGSKDARGGRR